MTTPTGAESDRVELPQLLKNKRQSPPRPYGPPLRGGVQIIKRGLRGGEGSEDEYQAKDPQAGPAAPPLTVGTQPRSGVQPRALLNTGVTAEPIKPIPVMTDINEAKAALGRRLFHDPRLSKNDTVSCATCHDPECRRG